MVADARTDHKTKVFLSYSRKDSAFVGWIQGALEESGYDVLIDKVDIAAGEDWRERIGRLIAEADTVVFCVSPNSAASSICTWEVQESLRLGKRILPVVARKVSASALPSDLAKLNFIFLDGRKKETGFRALKEALETDLQWTREHTRLGELARQWIRTHNSAILRGAALEEAEKWIASRPRSAALATELHRDFIKASRSASERRQRNWILGSVGVTLVSLLLGALAIWGQLKAERQTRIALANEGKALVALADISANEDNPIDALKLALAAWPNQSVPDRPASPSVFEVLKLALPRVHVQSNRNFPSAVAVFSPDAKHVFHVDKQGHATFESLETKTILAHFSVGSGAIRVEVSADNKTVIVDNQIWSLESGELLGVLHIEGGFVSVNFSFSPDGKSVAGPCGPTFACIWNASDGQLVHQLVRHSSSVSSARFSPSGTLLATTSQDKSIVVWNTQDGSVARQIEPDQVLQVTDAVFSDDSQYLAAIAWTDIILWRTADWSQYSRVSHEDDILALSFAPNSSKIASLSEDTTSRIWEIQESGLTPVGIAYGDSTGLALDFTPDGSFLLTASGGGSLSFRDGTTGRLSMALTHSGQSLKSAELSSNGRHVIAVAHDGFAYMFDTFEGGRIRPFASTPDMIAVSLDGKIRVTLANEHLQVIDTNNDLTSKLEGVDMPLVNSVISNDGSRFAAFGIKGPAVLWDTKTGERIADIGDMESIASMSFSPDGKWLAVGKQHELQIWQANPGNVERTFEIDCMYMQYVFFSPDSKRISLACTDQSIRILDIAEGKFKKVTISLETSEPESEAPLYLDPLGAGKIMYGGFTSDGTKIVLASKSGTVGVIDVVEGRVLTKLTSTLNGDFAAVLSGNGRRLYANVAGRGLSIVDTMTGVEVLVFPEFAEKAWKPVLDVSAQRLLMLADDTVLSVDVSGLDQGDALSVSCDRLLLDTEISHLSAKFNLNDLGPVCGANRPLPVEWGGLH